jgi:LysM repeat protein
MTQPSLPSLFASACSLVVLPRGVFRALCAGAVLCLHAGQSLAQSTEDELNEAVTIPPSDASAAPGSMTANPGQNGAQSDINSYLPSGDRPMVGGQSQDGFDLNQPATRGSVVISGTGTDSLYGAPSDDPGSSSSVKKPVGPAPEFHVVKKGDTLWQISQGYYGDAHNWPRLWSMNPQVENPHWIYPGDQLRTNQKGGVPSTSGQFNTLTLAGSEGSRQGFVGGTRTVPPGTIFLRDQGYIGDVERDDWGELVGAKEDRMLLAEGDTVYLVMKKGVDVRVGQRLNLFRAVRSSPRVPGARRPPGAVVKVFGTVRVDAWNKDDSIAKGVLIESIDSVERGTRVGRVGRRFDVVPPKPASAQVEARLLQGIYPMVHYGGQQVVFIDKGKEDGLVPGNRLRVLQRGDTWRRNLKQGAKHQRVRVEVDSDKDAPGERIPLHGDDEKFPDEIIGEVVVLRTEAYSSLCLVSQAKIELKAGDHLISTVGY